MYRSGATIDCSARHFQRDDCFHFLVGNRVFFGGISVTGTIARTATNIRAGARSPLAGIMHAAFILIFMLVAAPLASFIPLPALAGVLVVVCWNMAEKGEFLRLLCDWCTAVVLTATFSLTLILNLTFGT